MPNVPAARSAGEMPNVPAARSAGEMPTAPVAAMIDQGQPAILSGDTMRRPGDTRRNPTARAGCAQARSAATITAARPWDSPHEEVPASGAVTPAVGATLVAADTVSRKFI
jgi:hypothetical protein